MAKYQVGIVRRPQAWQPTTPDDVPADLGPAPEQLAVSENLFDAVRQAIAFNQHADRQGDDRWAVVVERGIHGNRWPNARLCTPITYKVTAIWRPEGWEPASPLDVPNCVWRIQSRNTPEPLPYEKAVATLRGLNQQNMDIAGDMWYVLMAVENEPISQAISYESSGMETTQLVRRLHVIVPEPGGHGDCTHCPAHSFQCAHADWSTLPQTQTDKETRQTAQ